MRLGKANISPRGVVRCLFLSFFFLDASLSVCRAEIGRIQTKRERMAHELRQAQASPQTVYQKIHESFLKEEYSNVDTLADQYLSRNPGAPDANDVLYLQALSLLKLDRSDEARDKLRRLENTAANPELKANASASIADSYYYEGNHARAYQSYKETMGKYPSSDQKDYLRERLLELSSEFGYTTVRDTPKNFPLMTPQKQVATEEIPFYAVQVGSFSKLKNAEQLVKKLLRQGYESYIADDKSHGMNRVRVGKFSSRSGAMRTEMKLRREGYPTKIVP